MAKLVTVLERHVCNHCKGIGSIGQDRTCEHCKGSGKISIEVLR